MYHSILIDTSSGDSFMSTNIIDTYESWHIVPKSRPTIVNPTVRTSYIDIPGASGSQDASEWLTGYPTYNDRSGSISFYVLNDYGLWTERRNEINKLIHGKKVKLMLEDEMDYFYKGRLEVNDWKSEQNWSTIDINYRFEPFKYSTNGTNSWKWDPFNFNTGETLDIYYSDLTPNLTRYLSKNKLPIQPSYGSFIVSESQSTFNIRFRNQELGIDVTKNLQNGITVLYDCLFSNLSGNNTVIITCSGSGKLSMDVLFRSI